MVGKGRGLSSRLLVVGHYVTMQSFQGLRQSCIGGSRESPLRGRMEW
jgi:hypothetical protein